MQIFRHSFSEQNRMTDAYGGDVGMDFARLATVSSVPTTFHGFHLALNPPFSQTSEPQVFPIRLPHVRRMDQQPAKPMHTQLPPISGSLTCWLNIHSTSTNPLIAAMSSSELAVSYAALILADDGVDITVRNSQFIVYAHRN
jgi:hypothetical protein